MTPRYKRGREVAGLSISQASRLLGIDRSRLVDIEATRIVPELGEVVAMADCYGASEAWLDGETMEPPPELVKALRDADVSFNDRAVVLELAAMLQGRRPR